MRDRTSTFLTWSTSVINLLIGVLGASLVATRLGPEARGTYQLVVLAGGTIADVLAMRALELLHRPAAAAEGPPDSRAYGASVSATLALSAPVAVVTSLVTEIGAIDGVYIAIAAASQICLTVLLQRATVRGDLVSFNAARLGSRLIFVALLAIAVQEAADYRRALAALVIANLVPVAVIAARVRRKGELRPTTGTHHRDFVLRPFAKSNGAALAQLAMLRLDFFYVYWALGSRSAGIYGLAATVAQITWQAGDAVSATAVGRARAEPGSWLLVRWKWAAIATAATLLYAVPVFVLAPHVLRAVGGSDYAEGSESLRLLLLGAVALASWRLLTYAATASGQTFSFAISAVVGLVVEIALIAAQHSSASITRVGASSAVAYLAATASFALAEKRPNKDIAGSAVVEEGSFP